MLTNLAASAELFHTAEGTAFADLMVDGHRETWPVRSIRMRSWLRRKYYEATGAAAGSGAINSALDLLEARAQFEKEFILSKLKENNWNITQTAKQVGLERSYLYRKMKLYGVEK